MKRVVGQKVRTLIWEYAKRNHKLRVKIGLLETWSHMQHYIIQYYFF